MEVRNPGKLLEKSCFASVSTSGVFAGAGPGVVGVRRFFVPLRRCCVPVARSFDARARGLDRRAQ